MDTMIVAAVFTLAGLLKGVVGLGLPTVSMGLLSLVLPPTEAAALLLLPSLVTNLWQMLVGPYALVLARRLAGMMAGVVVGTVATAGALTAAGGPWLGVALIAYGGLGLSGVRWTIERRHEGWAGPLVGLVTGAVTGVTGVFVLPAVPFLQAIGLERDALVQALGLSFTVSTVALAAGLWLSGGLPSVALGGSLGAVAPALLGMALGQGLRRHLGATAFRRAFFAGLLCLGAGLALQPLA
ncbi:MAG: sulfite exporter TauE/SafE family protein [Reyranellaceae bacterium]